MSFIGKAISGVFKAVGLVKRPRQPQITAVPQATRDDAAAQALANDELLRRKGGAADILTGTGGAEASRTGKTTLGS